MKPRIALMSCERLTREINRTADKDNLKKFLIINSSFDETLEKAKELLIEGRVDVFLCGGSNYEILKDKFPAPVIGIPITGISLLDDLIIAKTISDTVAIVTYKKTIVNFDSYGGILNIKIIQKCFNTYKELKNILCELKNKDITTIIGTSIVCDMCEEMKLDSIFIYSKDSLNNAVKQAILIQESIKKEKYKNSQLNAILNYAYSGIMATDANNIIQVYNPMAEKIMNMSKEKVIGKKVEDIIENTRLHHVPNTGEEEIDQLQRIGSKTILTSRIPILVGNQVMGAVATFQDIKHIQSAEHMIRRELFSKGLVSKYSFEDIKGKSEVIKESIDIARQYAKSDFTILLVGESGTGKELFAHSIHKESMRKNEAFVAVNCAALPASILESELFGYVEGAFTGAKKGGKMGLFEMAHNGTIFLDEIAEIPIVLQARLLRVIQEKEVLKLGSDKIIPIDVRIISATNRNLWEQVCDGKFREDLYYRLSVLEMKIPPLRNRKGDIPEISREFITSRFPNLYLSYKEKWEKIFCIIMNYKFLGNVRELQNVLKRLSVIIESRSEIDINEEEILNRVYGHEMETDTTVIEHGNSEISLIVKTLNEVNWNREEAAKQLGISRTTLWRKKKAYGIV